jgi:hypothetical protein
MTFLNIVFTLLNEKIIKNWQVDTYISQTLEPTATKFGQFVPHVHPRLPANFESTPPINAEVVQV